MSDIEYYQRKFHQDLAAAFAAASRGNWDEARKAFENRVAVDCVRLAELTGEPAGAA